METTSVTDQGEEPPRGLLLFDVDQTLVDILPQQTAAFATAFRTVFGIPGRLTDVAFAGMTTPNILRAVALLHGVTALLNALSATPHVLAVLTGIPPAIGELILRHTGLRHQFAFCTYGTEAATRADLVRLSLRKCVETYAPN